MPDYKEMYLTMMRASENAITALIDAQQKCEELYLNEGKVLQLVPEQPQTKDASE